MMEKLPHADSRSRHLSAKSGAVGHKPYDLALFVDLRRQHDRRSHYIVQIAMGWSDDHLHQFRIHAKRYGISRIGGISFSDDPDTVKLKDLGLQRPMAIFRVGPEGGADQAN